jgi:transposase
MDATPLKIRQLIIERDESGVATSEIAEEFDLCPSGVRRIKQIFRERRTLQPLPKNSGAKSGLSEERKTKLRELLVQNPDATLEELRKELGVDVVLSTIHEWTKKLGFSFKKSRSAPVNRTGPTSKPRARTGPIK